MVGEFLQSTAAMESSPSTSPVLRMRLAGSTDSLSPREHVPIGLELGDRTAMAAHQSFLHSGVFSAALHHPWNADPRKQQEIYYHHYLQLLQQQRQNLLQQQQLVWAQQTTGHAPANSRKQDTFRTPISCKREDGINNKQSASKFDFHKLAESAVDDQETAKENHNVPTTDSVPVSQISRDHKDPACEDYTAGSCHSVLDGSSPPFSLTTSPEYLGNMLMWGSYIQNQSAVYRSSEMMLKGKGRSRRLVYI
jgi:hypothetical protein